MKSSSWFALLSLLSPLALPAAEAADPCGGVRLAGGRVETGKPLVPGGADNAACLKLVAQELNARPDVRSITVAARLPDEARLNGNGLSLAKAAADALIAAGVPRLRVSAVAPPINGDETARIAIAYVERPARRPVARLRLAGQDVTAGQDGQELKAVGAGDVLYTDDVLRTGKGWVQLDLADASVLRVAPETLLRLGKIALNEHGQRQVELEVLEGTVEAQASKGEANSVFELKTRTAVAGVRGTRFRTSVVNDKVSRLETLEGLVVLDAGGGEQDVEGGYGSQVSAEAMPEKPRALLVAPDIQGPRAGKFPTSPRLSWQGVSGAKHYRVEVGRGADFVLDLHRYVTDTPELALESLPAGKWFWRVSPLDADGFEGYSSKIYAFDINP
ncbi:FecR family protein [Myxococcaceae bacterium GXIMD 01537]